MAKRKVTVKIVRRHIEEKTFVITDDSLDLTSPGKYKILGEHLKKTGDLREMDYIRKIEKVADVENPCINCSDLTEHTRTFTHPSNTTLYVDGVKQVNSITLPLCPKCFGEFLTALFERGMVTPSVISSGTFSTLMSFQPVRWRKYI